jgi:hypothetical protein
MKRPTPPIGTVPILYWQQTISLARIIGAYVVSRRLRQAKHAVCTELDHALGGCSAAMQHAGQGHVCQVRPQACVKWVPRVRQDTDGAQAVRTGILFCTSGPRAVDTQAFPASACPSVDTPPRANSSHHRSWWARVVYKQHYQQRMHMHPFTLVSCLHGQC